MISVNITLLQYDIFIICDAGGAAVLALSKPSVWLGCFVGYGGFVLGFSRDWVVMGGQCWVALSYPGGFIWWAGIGFICSVDRFVFATRTPHSSFELDFFSFLTSSEKRNSIEHNLIPSAPALDTCSCFDQSCKVELFLCPAKRKKKQYYSWDEIFF